MALKSRAIESCESVDPKALAELYVLATQRHCQFDLVLEVGDPQTYALLHCSVFKERTQSYPDGHARGAILPTLRVAPGRRQGTTAIISPPYGVSRKALRRYSAVVTAVALPCNAEAGPIGSSRPARPAKESSMLFDHVDLRVSGLAQGPRALRRPASRDGLLAGSPRTPSRSATTPPGERPVRSPSSGSTSIRSIGPTARRIALRRRQPRSRRRPASRASHAIAPGATALRSAARSATSTRRFITRRSSKTPTATSLRRICLAARNAVTP